jgi:archaellum component FlaC
VKTLEEKMFELMEKLYGEFKSLDVKVESIDAKVGSIDEKVRSLQKDVLRIENKLDTNSKALFDGYSQTYEKLTVIEAKVDDISSKVEKQDVEIRVIKGAK